MLVVEYAFLSLIFKLAPKELVSLFRIRTGLVHFSVILELSQWKVYIKYVMN